jgi:hypothetical protein
MISGKENKDGLYVLLENIGLGSVMIEDEEITLYPQVRKQLEKKGMLHYFDVMHPRK